MLRWLALSAAAAAIAGCSTPVPDAAQTGEPESMTAPEVSRSSRPSSLSLEAQRALARRGMVQHDMAPVSVESRCSRVDEIGTATRLTLAVTDGEVGSFDADVSIRGRGRCRFALADFRQEAREPQVLLRHARDKNCTVRMWREQQEKVTVAFTNCQKSCEGRAFDYLWPILVESRTGQCF